MGVVRVGPTTHQRQPFVVKGADPAGVGLAHLERLVFFFEDVFLLHHVAEGSLAALERHFVPRLQVNDVAKDLTQNVVVSGEYDIASLTGKPGVK